MKLPKGIDRKDCELWTGAGSNPKAKGCGTIQRYDSRYGRTVSKTPARYFWEQKHGYLKPSYQVGHLCGVSLCINLKHLIAGTRLAICQIASERGTLSRKKKTHCKQGHPLSGENLYIFERRNGTKTRRCRECKNKRTRENLRRIHGWKPRQKRKHPNLSDPEKMCRKKLHFFTKENTLVYWHSVDKAWRRHCRECTNKRNRMDWRKEHGKGNMIKKYREEWVESYGV